MSAVNSASSSLTSVTGAWLPWLCQVDREGNVVQRYGSSTTPLQIEADIQKLL